MIERDYIMRLFQQLANVLARIMRAREQEKYDEAHGHIDAAYGELFGLSAALVEAMTAESLVTLLGDKEKAQTLARLLKEEGDVGELEGDSMQAAAKHRKALELYLAALDSRSTVDAETRGIIKALLDKIGIDRLPANHRATARRLMAHL